MKPNMNQAAAMKQVQRAQAEMARIQDELKSDLVSASAGGGAVKIAAGDVAIKIDVLGFGKRGGGSEAGERGKKAGADKMAGGHAENQSVTRKERRTVPGIRRPESSWVSHSGTMAGRL